MTQYKFDRKSYLQRTMYAGEETPNNKTLKELHKAQLHSIPFENFDVLTGSGINLEAEALFDKLVHKKRGGYCFELNGLFLQVLKDYKFDARALLGRVHVSGTPSGRGHQITLVTIDNKKWIVDTGFGAATPRAPIPLEFNTNFDNDGQILRLMENEEFGIMLQSKHDETWKNLYSFNLDHVCAGDIQYGNHFTSTHPESIFTTSRIATLRSSNGSYILHNNTLKINLNDKEKVLELSEGIEYIEALETYFGIKSLEVNEYLSSKESRYTSSNYSLSAC